MCFGWTWEHIDAAVTLVDYYAMQEYWQRFPPVHESVATYLGIASSARPVAASASSASSGRAPTAAEILAGGERVTELDGDLLSTLDGAAGVTIAPALRALPR